MAESCGLASAAALSGRASALGGTPLVVNLWLVSRTRAFAGQRGPWLSAISAM